jgi:hypothetical protein
MFCLLFIGLLLEDFKKEDPNENNSLLYMELFIVSSNVKVNRDNVFSIPEDETESQAYIAASDLVITKAGWGTVSEAVVYNVLLLILNREGEGRSEYD